MADPNFARLWLARTVSLVGDYAFRVALITYVISVTGSATVLALVTASLLVPTVVFYVLGGVVGDRVRSRRRVLVVTDSARFVAAGGVAVFALLSDSLIPLVALAIPLSVGEGFFRPASFAILPEIVDRERLTKANSANSIGQQIGIIGGPLVGGVLAAAVGPAAAFGFNAATFLCSAILIAGIRQPSRLARPDPAGGSSGSSPGGVLAEARAGLGYLRHTRWLLVTCLVGAGANAVFTGALAVAVPLVLAPGGTGQAEALGWYYALQGVGALLGAVLLARLTIVRIGIGLHGMMVLMATALVVVGLLGNLPPVYLSALAYGVGLHFFNSLFPTLLQSKVPSEILGRVSSFALLAIHGLMPVGAASVGPLAAATSPRVALVGTGLVVAVVCLLVMQHATIRTLRLDRPAADGASTPTPAGAAAPAGGSAGSEGADRPPAGAVTDHDER